MRWAVRGVAAAGLAVAAVSLFWITSRPGGLRLDRLNARILSPGIELVEADLRRGGAVVGRFAAVYAKLDAVRPSLALNEDGRPVDQMCPDAFLVTNAGFFTPERRATGLLVSHGEVLSRFVPQAGGAGSGVLVVERGHVRLLERDRVGPRRFADAELAIQAGPRVIEPGGRPGIRSDDGARANRTFIGADGDGRLAVGVIHGSDGGQGTGPSLYELQQLLGPHGIGRLSGGSYALDLALNLDGGPSTGWALRTGPRASSLSESNRVLSVLALERSTEATSLANEASESARP